ncbi:CopD family protein [Candidatus Liberibacter sp.]|uniref:CopD family protein n=1 Tax=Candidatus Liberibacter sp. TaxID=34022 RepID=UPI0015F6E9FD|nr:CopD family protein [Candidatus Liberibacter sp.]MBA5723968.1 CopD family protein [Candidatus Liberibacter sp.]
MRFLLLDSLERKPQIIAFVALVFFLLLFFFLSLFTFQLYLLIKSLHIISIISWMAGLLYMPRIFVYHSSVLPDTTQYKTFEIMEERLLKVIMNPAMILSWVCGLYMIVVKHDSPIGWFRVKMVCTFIISIYHIYLAFVIKDFKNKTLRHGSTYFKIINEIPTVLMILIVFLSIVRPF